MNEQKIHRVVNIAFIVMFLTGIWLPNIDSMFGIAPHWANTEQRSMEKLPPLRPNVQSIRAFQGKFMKYFVDNFGFRGLLIRWNTIFKLDILKVRQFPKVLVGDEGWLYLVKDDEGNNALDYYRNVTPFANERECAEWARPLVDLERYCAARGIGFLTVFVPMKPRIYPEHIPPHYGPVRKTSRLDQMIGYLRRKTRVRFIDCGPALLEAKKERQVFFKHDVHWNLYGAYRSYRAIAEELRRMDPAVVPISEDHYAITTFRYNAGDLASMLGIGDRFSEISFGMPARFHARAKRILPPPYTFKGSRFTDFWGTGDPSLPRVVVYHDSFFNYVKFFLAENTSRMACFQSYGRIDLGVIDREKPDLVICQIAESFLQKSPAYVTFTDAK
jgi:alginate O-acetyltransferase complex protein AlgJ